MVSLAVSPDYAHDQTLLALAYWPTPTAGGQQFGVFRSEDGGANWVEGSTGIAAASLFDITFSPGYAQDQTAYLTTLDGGLYRSQDGGQTWQLLGGAPGMPALYDVVIREDNRVFVGSQSGVWQYIEEPYRTHLPLFYGRIFAP